ncbi:hypothetical protein BDV96DRAFT_561152 [Lophiotrema nucula]|uniref:F-box domain-containing protein n=1 Tax=Lophiotrema nucula TaxID=690887 RepID=A0A6A5ZUJ5_9PLEO|nr:hypothetical protein BDV96DRAFT_561152 [Lophiotrema nucula]
MVLHRLKSLLKGHRKGKPRSPEAIHDPEAHTDSPSLEDHPGQLKLEPQYRSPVYLPETNAFEYLRNHEFSRLYQLPNELLLIIGDHLKRTEIIALRLAGRHFHRVFKAPRHPDWMEARKFAELMQEDVFLWHCRRERAFGAARIGKLTCSKCRCLHPMNHFTEQQSIEEQAKRVCKAAEGRVWICEHASMTFDEVVGLRAMKVMAGGKEIFDFKICTHPTHGSNAADLAQCAPMISTKSDGTYVISRSMTITTGPADSHLSKEQLVQALSNKSEFVCPHTFLCDHEVILPAQKYLPFEPEEVDYPFYKSQLDIHRPVCSLGYCRVCNSIPRFCQKMHCGTKWILSRRHGAKSADTEEYAIHINRSFGPRFGQPLKPIHKTWQLQIDQVEGIDECSDLEHLLEDGKSFLDAHELEVDPLILYLRASGIQGSNQALYMEGLLPNLVRWKIDSK